MKTIFRLGILGFVALLVAQVLPAQQAPSELHHSPFFARGYNPEPVPTVPVMGIPEVVVHLGYQTYFTVTNVGAAAADVRFRFFSAAGEEIEIPLEVVRDSLANRSLNPAAALPLLGFDVSSGTGLGGPIFPAPEPVENPFRLEAGASLQIATSLPSEPGFATGSVQVESSRPVGVSQALSTNFVVVRASDVIPLQLSVTQLEPSAVVRGFSVFLRDNPLFAVGVALRSAALAEGETASGTLRLLNPEGLELARAEVTLSGRQGLMRPLREILPRLPLFVEGTLVGEFNQDVLVSSVTFFKRMGQVYSANPIIRIDPRFSGQVQK